MKWSSKQQERDSQKRKEAERAQWERRQHEENIAAAKAIADQLAIDQQQQNSESDGRARRERITIALLLLTFTAAAVGDVIFYDTMADARYAFETGSRAWISPIAVGLTTPIENGQPISVQLQYDNVGKQPALDLHERYQVVSEPNAAMDDGTAMADVEKSDVCAAVEPFKDAEVVYPSSGGVRLTLSIKSVDPRTGQHVKIYDELVTGNHTLIVQFCIAYRTLESTRKSAFCYFYRPGYSAGKDLNRCDKGNHAT